MDFSALNAAVLDVFGEDQDNQPVFINGRKVQAIYDSRHYADESGEGGASDLITTISVLEADYPVDATVIIARGKTYRTWEARPDGQGMTVIVLERAEASADLDQAENSFIAAILEEDDN